MEWPSTVGFSGDGTETLKSQRDPNPETNGTVLSGDLAGDDGPNFTNTSENAYHVVSAEWLTSTTIVDGFSVQSGNADAPRDSEGGGLLLLNSQGLEFHNILMAANQASYLGGGAYFESSEVELYQVSFKNNQTSGFIGSGGAVKSQGSYAHFEKCLFDSNSCQEDGGAISATHSSEHTFLECLFSNNQTMDNGGGIFCDHSTNNMRVIQCSFSNNSAGESGGGIADYGDAVVELSTFSENQAAFGGGILSANRTTISSCTLVANSASTSGGGLWISDSSRVTVFNTLIVGNASLDSAPEVRGQPFQEAGNLFAIPSNVLIDDIVEPISDNGGATPTYRLTTGSPAIDAGANGFLSNDRFDLDQDSDLTEVLPVDQRGSNRINDGSVDIGAYESIPSPEVMNVVPSGHLLQGDDSIALQFNQPIALGPGTLSLVVTGTNIEIPCSFAVDFDTLTLTPLSPLPIETFFSVLVDGDALFGLQENYSGTPNPSPFNFHTRFREVYLSAPANFQPANPTTYTEVTWEGRNSTAENLVFGANAFTSLQEASDNMCEGGKVFIAEGNYQEGEEVFIEKSITIIGDGADTTILDGNQLHRLLQISENAEVSIEGLSFINGKTADGIPGIFDGENTTRNGGDGGNGAAILSLAPLSLNACKFSGNLTGNGGDSGGGGGGGGGSGGSGGFGGAICSLGDLILNDCFFTANQTGKGGYGNTSSFGGSGGHGGDGGAVYCSGLLEVRDTTFEQNQTGPAGLGDDSFQGRGGNGGALFSSGTANISQSFFHQNQTGYGGGATQAQGGGHGGAVASFGEMALFSCLLSENSTGDGVGDVSRGGYGGALYSYGSVYLDTCSILQNRTGNGGGYGSGGDGGGIAALLAVAMNSTIESNHTGGGGIPEDLNGGRDGHGGGIYASVNLTRCTISLNHTGEPNANRLGIGGGSGGGIYGWDSTLTLCTLSSNRTGLAISSGPGRGGVAGNGAGFCLPQGSLTIDSCTFMGNQTGFGDVGTGQGGDGAAFYNGTYYSANVRVSNSILIGNYIPGGLGGINSALVESVTNGAGGYVRVGGNLLRTPTGLSPSDILLPLADIGGPTWVHPLTPGSPAIDSGDNSLIPSTLLLDQIGAERISNGTVDIGAVEHGAPPLDLTSDLDSDGSSLQLELALGTNPNFSDPNHPNNLAFSSLQAEAISLTFGRADVVGLSFTWILERSPTLAEDSFTEIYRFRSFERITEPASQTNSSLFTVHDETGRTERNFYRVRVLSNP